MGSNEDKELRVTVNDEVSDLNQFNQAILKIDGQEYVLKSNNHSSNHQKLALRYFLIPAVIGTLIYFLFFNSREQLFIQLIGRISIASAILLIGSISGVITFAIAFIVGKRIKLANLENIYWRNVPTILLSFAIIIALAILFFFYLLGLLFEGLVLDIYLSTLLTFIFISIINYVMISFVMVLSPSLMTKLLVVVILSGVIISMITDSEAQWWQRNLSFLGTQEASGAWQFNFTLMLSAFMMIALVDYLFVGLKKIYPKHRPLTILRILLTITAICLGLVGYFPSDGPGNMPKYHNQSAAMLVYMIIAMIIGIKWFVPKVSREFVITSYVLGLMLFVVTYYYLTGWYITLTGFEIVSFVLAFTWLMLLLQTLDKASREPIPVYDVDIEFKKETESKT